LPAVCLDFFVICEGWLGGSRWRIATSIHKSQGSEYPGVIIPIAMQHYVMLKRNLIYTGITRGKRLVVLVGQRKALAIAVRGRQVDRRWSKLRQWLG
jgi:exodeoxyribonuclease V alpha subunit